jgi:uncharacterized membrane protein YozB (DUF420 family)
MFTQPSVALPLILLTIFFIVTGILRLRKRPLHLGIITFLVFLILALMLPGLLESLPQWMIPPRFSDFSFWSTMLTGLGTDLQEHLKQTPRLRDVSYMILFYKQIGLSFISIVMALLVCIHGRCALYDSLSKHGKFFYIAHIGENV